MDIFNNEWKDKERYEVFNINIEVNIANGIVIEM
jgi:hypothetical protein